MIVVSKATNFPFIMKMPSNEKKMKKQHKMYAIDVKMPILAKFDTQVGTRVDLEEMIVL
jgi:hypothetical protein